ncbi:dihydrofolate reductase [Paucibacter sp. R3-3]|uniref:Dihydrofolate reductase n=1 Tax=Roseateles agri TaxID=3098619 RepID=A0ABU5DHP2_9BURK|nr:dihydrofolate reductase [Paucibacter sp. R3-3]MDY0745805.1 dihydrofolate reductase [Paucibacter sp. R3-3]
MRLSLIVGLGRNREIGRDNGLLWHLPGDLPRFKALTMGHAVIMGRKTWDSLPERFRPLPGRRNIVLSRQPALQLAGAEVFRTLEEALAACAGDADVFVIGGAQIYTQALPLADRLELTEVEADFPDADAFFPAWDRSAFEETARATQMSAEGWRYDFVTYQRK